MRLTALLLLLSLNCFSQRVDKVLCDEYGTFYITTANRVTFVTWNGSAYVPTDMGLSNIVDGAGGQYACVVGNSSGNVWTIDKDANVTTITTDEFGRTITGAQRFFCLKQMNGYEKSDTPYVFGQDLLNIHGGTTITQPIRLNNPTGRTVKKIVPASINTDALLALCYDSTVWLYTPSGGKTPTQVTGFTGGVADIAAISQVAYVAVTLTKIYTWSAAFYNTYLGVSNVTTPTDITSNWTSIGVQFPLKKVIGNYYALHLIDANDNLFTAGQDMNGETGQGSEYSPWRTYKAGTSSMPYHDDISRNQRILSPAQIKGAKVKDVMTGNYFCFYTYMKDMADSLYSYGRNKTQSLGNGLTVSDSCQSDLNAWGNITAPRYVNPLYTSWSFAYGGSKGSGYRFNPNTAKPPLANAGLNQYITSSSTTLYGQGSSQQEGTITAYKWTKVSGTGGTITYDTAVNTTVTGLSTGSYTFQLRVTNSNGAKDSITVKVVVDIPSPSGCQIIQSAVPNVNYTYKCLVDPCDTVKYVRVYYSLDGKTYTLRMTGLSNAVSCSIPVKKKDPLYVRADVELKNGKKFSKLEIF